VHRLLRMGDELRLLQEPHSTGSAGAQGDGAVRCRWHGVWGWREVRLFQVVSQLFGCSAVLVRSVEAAGRPAAGAGGGGGWLGFKVVVHPPASQAAGGCLLLAGCSLA
jgi:hypothetical protein